MCLPCGNVLLRRIRFISQIRGRSNFLYFFRTRMIWGTVFQTDDYFVFYNPETSSRVTLASLGTVFQTGHTYSVDSDDSCSALPLSLFSNTDS